MENEYFVMSYIFPDIIKTKIMFSVNVGVQKPDFYLCHKVKAIVDTGAGRSCITKNLASDLGLVSEENSTVITATSIESVPSYKGVDLTLTNGLEEKIFENLTVEECLKSPISGYDFIIGMDVLTTGDMVISTAGGKTAFSFRTPSKSHLIFSKENGEIQNKIIPESEWEKINNPNNTDNQ